ncbi:hypothetical protein FE904_17885 [Chryseobacterium indologenes]|uniref:hypothetical protein n=1 Tax=Chryseobacterium indologenes TaxID=253 RepID=UPI001108BDB5|nr:hypothetical protein [Chryseobacterium indologenes]TLX24137.1 hypothetical protein FE904_17885 [Chryseobacterium indologenes]
MNADLQAFRKNIPWAISDSDHIEFSEMEKGITLSEKFTETFPVLTNLINNARILDLKINGQPYYLLSWTNKDNESCGWLNKIEQDSSRLPFIEEHQLLLNEIGGIQESYQQPDRAFTNNQNFLFLGSACSTGIEGWENYYEETCGQDQKSPIDYNNLISFAEEVNGNLTLYDPKTKKILLFAPGHAFENVEPLKNQPEYTFYTINSVPTFVDYVETLATEWKEEIRTSI